MEMLLRCEVDAGELVRAHPPVIGHAHKRMVTELCGLQTTGRVVVSRWRAGDITSTWHDTEVIAERGHYRYDAASDGVWHVNFADPALFVAYGSALLAQDELQCLEHPILGSVRELLDAEDQAWTETRGERGVPTPVLVAGAERRCALDTRRLYGNQFARASADDVRAALQILAPPTRSNIVAMAAPVGSGAYTREDLEQILVTATTGFAAAVAESARLWPGTPVEVRTGFWGCGAFGGNRHVMTILQIAAARLAGIARLRFYAFDDAGQAVLADARAFELGDDPIAAVLARGYRWGMSDGN
ncbi:MAG: hypothetical protein JO257_15390 [Deltaproteobacteria bacterium]|nr:hypothetical protein [Deltaproteobacteria bacterium]